MIGVPVQNWASLWLTALCRVGGEAGDGAFLSGQAAQSGLHGNVGPRRLRSGTYLSVENCVFPQTIGI